MKKIVVVGAGTMGNGIAHVFAQSGYPVTLSDISKTALDKALSTISKNLDRQVFKGKLSEDEKSETISNIATTTDLEKAVKDCDLVIEAATENEIIKLEIFKSLDTYTGSNTILATNTSSISITKIAAVTSKPANVIGMHFMNPVPVMKLVEIINGYSTDKAITDKIISITNSLGKTPVSVNDYPGFIANRILMPMINESIISLFEGVAGVKEIDEIMKLGMAHPMGPLQLAVFIGLDVCFAILKVLHEGLGNPKYAPCPLLVNMVRAGHLGIKSGVGFYSYAHGTKELIVAGQFST